MNSLFNIRIALTVFVFLLANNTKAHTLSTNNNIWFHYVGKLNLSPKWSVTLEATKRYTDMGRQPQQWFVRPSVDYALSKQHTLSMGYTHYKTFSYGQPAMFYMPVPEDHAWVQINSKVKAGKGQLQLRLRHENRFVGLPQRSFDSATNTMQYRISGYEYRMRLRFMFLYTIPVLQRQDKPLLSLIAGDEAFFNLGRFSGSTLMNQNRIIAGLAWHAGLNTQLQLAYIHQHIWNFSNTILESNPTVRISLFHTLNLKPNVKTKP